MPIEYYIRPLPSSPEFKLESAPFFWKIAPLLAVGYPSGQRGQTVNLLAYAFLGSNPRPTTILTPPLRLRASCLNPCHVPRGAQTGRPFRPLGRLDLFSPCYNSDPQVFAATLKMAHFSLAFISVHSRFN